MPEYHLDDKGKLYDLVADPGQRHEINDSHPDVVSRMQTLIKQWKSDVLC